MEQMLQLFGMSVDFISLAYNKDRNCYIEYMSAPCRLLMLSHSKIIKFIIVEDMTSSGQKLLVIASERIHF